MNNYRKWKTLSNPPAGTFNNIFVNYYNGVSVVQTTPSPLHDLAASVPGKQFHFNSDINSQFDVSVRVTTESGPTTFNIPPGDSAIFVYTGSGVWDQVGGEEVIRESAPGGGTGGGGSGAQNQIARQINFDDEPDSGLATFVIGDVPSNGLVTDISVNVVIPFDDSVADQIQVASNNGSTIVLGTDLNDIKKVGNYVLEFPALDTTANNTVVASFNARPNAGGGTQGRLSILVEYMIM